MNTSSTLPPFWETVRVPGMRWLDLWLYSAGAIELCKSIIARSPCRVHFALSKSCCLFSSVCAFLFLFSFDLCAASISHKSMMKTIEHIQHHIHWEWREVRVPPWMRCRVIIGLWFTIGKRSCYDFERTVSLTLDSKTIINQALGWIYTDFICWYNVCCRHLDETNQCH